ncbi:MAG: LacI family DNA-binding transcriptional regulator [Thermaceae bacterium]|nr:LacI family DNA-binding transcriptional regulator [Thermaceae bacterium]
MPPKRKPTIHEVAHLARVGIGTVSRVLNNNAAVRPETRARVQAAMDSLGYRPNPHARRVAGGRSYTVSVILPFVATEFYTRLVEGIERVLDQERYDIALFPLLSRGRLERYLESSTLAYQTDGLIIASYDLTELFGGNPLPTDRPVVFVDAHNTHYDSAYIDNYLGGSLAAAYLAPFKGDIFAVKLEEEIDRAFTNTVFAERLNGFSHKLAGLGRPLPESHVFTTRFSAEGGQLALRQFITLKPPPYNIFAGADLIALGVLEEAERQGLQVGHEVRILGYDGQPWTEARGLSTLVQPVEEMGAEAARMLLERIQGYRGGARGVRFEPTLVERSSTKPSRGTATLAR